MNLSLLSWPRRSQRNSAQDTSLDIARTFEFRLNSTHTGCDNSIATLHVEYLANGEWRPFDLNVQTRGFQIFVYSCFICQHTYLRMNATELGLAIAFVDGSFKLTTTRNWQVFSVIADFEVYLADGTIDSDGTRYLIDRMKGCPVSRNLGHDVTKKTQLVIHHFEQPSEMQRSDMQRSDMHQPRLVRSPQAQFQSQPQSQSQRRGHPPQKLTNSTILSLNSSGL